MYFGDLGQGHTGSRFRIIAPKGARRVNCPPGTTEESRGTMATGQGYAWCHRAPQFAPPATTTVTYEAPRTTTTVSPGIQTAISPQISPTLAQQQASPGAGVSASPGQTSGGQQADTGYRPGLTGEQVAAMMDAERRAREADAKAAAQAETIAQMQRTQELETFRKVYEQAAADQNAAMQREMDAAAAREAAQAMADTEAQASAQQSALYIPPPASMIPQASPMTEPSGSTMTPDSGAPVEPAGTPWGMILLTVAAVGIVAAGAKKRKGKR